MRMRSLCIALSCTLAGGACWSQQPVDLSLLVLRQMKAGTPPQPFPDVGGIQVRQQSGPYEKATCPDRSNNNGELVCRVQCDKTTNAFRLYVKAPSGSTWSGVRGYTPPAEEAIDIVACKVQAAQKRIQLVYLTFDALVDTWASANPGVGKVVGAKDAQGNWKFRPLSEASKDLERVAATPEGREALLKLSEISGLYAESGGKAGADGLANLEQYKVGAKTLSLKGIAVEAFGVDGAGMVNVSPNSVDFAKGVTAVEDKLGSKGSLTSKDAFLIREVKSIKQTQPR